MKVHRRPGLALSKPFGQLRPEAYGTCLGLAPENLTIAGWVAIADGDIPLRGMGIAPTLASLRKGEPLEAENSKTRPSIP